MTPAMSTRARNALTPTNRMRLRSRALRTRSAESACWSGNVTSIVPRHFVTIASSSRDSASTVNVTYACTPRAAWCRHCPPTVLPLMTSRPVCVRFDATDRSMRAQRSPLAPATRRSRDSRQVRELVDETLEALDALGQNREEALHDLRPRFGIELL